MVPFVIIHLWNPVVYDFESPDEFAMCDYGVNEITKECKMEQS